MPKRLLIPFTFAVVLFALTGAASAQQQTVSDGVKGALQGYVLQGGFAALEETPLTKAVPRTDKAEATVIGTLTFVDAVDFLDDGTPFRLVGVQANRPFSQEIFIFCLGSSSVNACGRLIEGRRVQFTANILVIEEGDEAGLALFVASRIRT